MNQKTQDTAQIEELQARLEEAQETLRAIRRGEVDALVVEGPQGEQIYTLKGADEPYRVMVEAMAEAAATFSTDGTILYCNSRFAELMKVPLEQVIGSALQGFVAPDERRSFDIPAVGGREAVRREIALQAADGARVPALFSAQVLKLDKMEAIIAVITDLTELKQKEREIGKRMKELRAFYHLSGLSEREDFALDDLYRELAHVLPESWQYPEIACARIVMGESEFRSGNFNPSEWVQAAPVKVHGTVAGKIEVGYLEARPEEDEGPFLKQERQLIDAIAELVGHITARKRAEDELRKHHIYLEHMIDQRTTQFEAVSMELEGFAYSISHDLRVPMRAIDGFSGMLLKHHADKLDEEGKRCLNLVRDNTKRMNMLFDDILALSRMGRQKITLAPVDMEALAREAFEELKPGLAGRALDMEIKPLPPCDGDRTMLRMVWINLLGNAIKFTRPKAAARVEIGGRTEGEEQVYYIKDNGVGFDMQYADKLFGVFQRLHSVEEFEGTGIDLAIVKRIITRHGGRVWAEGKVGEGATFYFALPLQEGKT